ncbi:MAG: hypothetical protein J6T51_04140, partial [Kiritimatiellae bacterium]|nr:hypothetical protein [Kiritimatiellia bacterium]
MKTYRMSALALAVLALSANAMEALPLDGLWDFSFAEGRPLAEATFDFRADDKMPVPCCFDLTSRYYMKRGTAQYRRSFALRMDVAGAYLKVKGMGLRLRLWLDGREIGSSKLAFSELEFPTGPLKAGEHVLVAALDNRLFPASDEMFQPYYDYLGSGGFYHGVELSFDNRRLLVRTRDYRSGTVEIEAVNFAERDFDATLLFDGKNEVAAKFRNGRCTAKVPDFKLWSPDAPDLHTVSIKPTTPPLAADDCELTARFGIREFKCAKGRFWLNGESVFLKGVNRHDSDAADGYATTRQSMWRDLQLIKGLGANFVRTSHYTPSEEFLDLCDEAGVLVWEETLGWQNRADQMSNEEFVALSLEQARLMARKSINHPSVVIDAFLNEFNSRTKEGRTLANLLVDALHAEDTGRPVSYATCRPDGEIANEKTDFIAFNLYPAWHQEVGTATTPESMARTIRRRLGEVARLFRERHGPDKPIMIGETGCYSMYGCHDPAGAQWSEEFQAEYLGNSVGFAIEDEDIQGVAVWQFCDSRTYFRGGADVRTRPMGQNMAGLFDIYRREKLAAKTVRRLFRDVAPAPAEGRPDPRVRS